MLHDISVRRATCVSQRFTAGSVRDRTENQLQAPADTGMYEVRYVLREGSKTLASTPIEVTTPEVTVDAPETAQ